MSSPLLPVSHYSTQQHCSLPLHYNTQNGCSIAILVNLLDHHYQAPQILLFATLASGKRENCSALGSPHDHGRIQLLVSVVWLNFLVKLASGHYSLATY